MGEPAHWLSAMLWPERPISWSEGVHAAQTIIIAQAYWRKALVISVAVVVSKKCRVLEEALFTLW